MTFAERLARKEVLRRALQYLAVIKGQWQDFLDEREAWYTYGDGKRKGWAYPVCFHGASQWTDYDNICAGCEDSFNGYNPLSFYRWALAQGWSDYNEHKRRAEWFASAPPSLWNDRDMYNRIIEWVMEPIRKAVR